MKVPDSLDDLLKGVRILVTGGTGSFGSRFIQRVLSSYDIREIVVYSRDEMKQWEMASKVNYDSRVKFFLGDVRDEARLLRASRNVDFIIHAAALKIIPTAEYYPEEYISTNIHGAIHVSRCATENGVKKVIALSTDKACNPVNLYGATKLASDKIFIAANGRNSEAGTLFSVVRYGNVMGSRGSVIPFFLSRQGEKKIPITDTRMTRFMITLDQAVDLVLFALAESVGGEIYVPKLPSMNIMDIAATIVPDAEAEIIGVRPGEKLHEEMISEIDARSALEYPDHFKIFPQIKLPVGPHEYGIPGTPCADGFRYASDVNTEWMTKDYLRSWLEQEKGMLGYYGSNVHASTDAVFTLLESQLLLELQGWQPRGEGERERLATLLEAYRRQDFRAVAQTVSRVVTKDGGNGALEVLRILAEGRLGHTVDLVPNLAAAITGGNLSVKDKAVRSVLFGSRS